MNDVIHACWRGKNSLFIYIHDWEVTISFFYIIRYTFFERQKTSRHATHTHIQLSIRVVILQIHFLLVFLFLIIKMIPNLSHETFFTSHLTNSKRKRYSLLKYQMTLDRNQSPCTMLDVR